MHVVTKILVVFCAVLSLLLAALTMSYSANAASIRESYRQIELDKLAAESTKKDLESSISQMAALHETKIRAMSEKETARDKELIDLQAQRTQLRTEVEQAKGAAEGIKNQIALLAATAETQAQMIKSYRDEVSALRDETLSSNRREIELTDRIRDLEGQREVLEQTARALREQLRETQIALENNASGNKAGTTGVFEHVGPAIFARVLEVGKLPTGEDYVTISEGANRDIKPNMLLNIVRGGEFIGTIVVLNVDPQRSVGKVNLKKSDIQPQDTVLSRLIP